MNKAELIASVVASTNLPKKDVEATVNAVISTIQDAVVAGDKVNLTGFLTLSSKVKPASTGRNPSTGEQISIPERKAVKVVVGKSFKEAVK